MSSDSAILDLTLTSSANGYRLQMKFRAPNHDVPREKEFPTALNPAELLPLESDAVKYGQALYYQLFAEHDAEKFFAECRATAGTASLRLRLCLRPEANELHRLRWETLRTSQGDPLTTGDRVWFSRYLSSDETRDIPLRPRADLRALVVIANPANSGLAPIDVKAERERVLQTWGDDKSITVLDGVTGERATLQNTARHLRNGYDVLYLVAHGKFNKDESESALWLEDDTGNVARVKGEELLAQLGEITQWPRLIVLLSCQSAHSYETRALLSLGPRLSAKGIPAVLALQGDFSMATSIMFMPEFFRELRQHGQIDYACAMARSVVRKSTDAWMPALFLRTESGRLWEEDTTAPAPGTVPYKGLAAFTEADAMHFFGRADEIQKLKTRLGLVTANPGPTGRFLAVVGASGSGKSSLVQAGLIPELTKTGQWVIAPVYRPQALNTQLEALDGLISIWRTANPQVPNILLVVDQFEEIFTLESSAPQREYFIQKLLQLAQQPGPVCIVITLRSDFFTACLQHADLRLALENRQFLLGAMTREALTQAIMRPAEQGQWEFEPGLVGVILDDVSNEPGNLPLLSQALLETWHNRAGRRLTLKGYTDAGGVEKALANRAQVVYDSLAPRQQPIARHIFVQLTHLGEGQQDTRRRVRVSQLLTQTYILPEVQAVLKALTDGRLVVTDQLQNETLAEVAHEALIRAWPNLRIWLNEDREDERLRRELEKDAEAWLKAGKPTGLLYRAGAKLARAEEWATRNLVQKTKTIEDFVFAAQAETRHERQKEKSRLRIISVMAVVAVIASVVAIVFGLNAQSSAKEAQNANSQSAQNLATAQIANTKAANSLGTAVAESNIRATQEVIAVEKAALARSRQLAAQSLNLITRQLDSALLLGVEAYRYQNKHFADPYESRGSLLSTLTANPRLRGHLQGHMDSVMSVAFSPDRKTLASASADQTVRLWDVTNPVMPMSLGEPLTGHSNFVWSVAFSPDGKTLASASADQTVRLWDVTNPAMPTSLGEPLTGHSNSVWSVAFSPDGKTLASASADQTVRLWNVANPAVPRPLGEPLIGHIDLIRSVAFSPDGKTLASASADQTVRLWDVTNPAIPKSLGEPLTGHTKFVHNVAFSPDGKTLASASADQTVRLWDVTNPAMPKSLGEPLIGHTASVWSVVFSPNGQILASAGPDQTVRLWDVANPTAPKSLGESITSHTNSIWSIAFSIDGNILASAGDDGTVRLWNVANPAVPKSLGEPLIGHTNYVLSVAFSPDGYILASSSADQTVRLWNVVDPAAPKPLGKPLTEHTDWVREIAFSPDGKMLASASDDQTVRLWNMTNPAVHSPFNEPINGHTNSVWSVAFSPDGQTLASANDDQTVRLWDVANPAVLRPLGEPLIGHTDRVWSVAFSPDGKMLASASADGTIILWPTSLEDWIMRACNIAGRNFTQAEWQTYFPDEPYRLTCPQFPAGN